ncbi:MAG TPA: hypothetical protein VIR30_04950 [Nocardioides sp.]|uniref:TPM domain-containing protein n=1 Tax=Nocardioides daedukensis TaxID=634462 RepID=A0A7Y9S3E9_9ACTN|nr:hypothetical protein [Nocardioides daedukensis]NYG60289.1 hypothetical protein [Nocardioides daedukensis]
MRNAVANLVLAALAALLCGFGASAWFTDKREQEFAQWQAYEEVLDTPRDRVRNAIEGIRKDGVHVAPDGRTMVDEADEKRLEKAIAARGVDEVPVRVIVWQETNMGGSYLQTEEQLERALADDEPGVLVIWEGPESGDVMLTGGRDGYPFQFNTSDFVGDPTTALLAGIDQLTVTWHDDDSEFDYWGGTGGGIAAGVMIALGVLLGIGLFFWLVRTLTGGLLKLPGGWR